MNLKLIFNKFCDYALLSIGVLIYCMGWTSFMLPNGISSGGLTGICTIVQYATNGAIPLSYSFFVVNTILIVIGTLIMGKGFGFKTIYAYLLSSLFLYLLPNFEFLEVHMSEKMFVAIIAGCVEAFGISLVLNHGGSTGGTDIIAVVVNKFWPMSLGKVYMYCDLFIIFSIVFLPDKGFEDMMYGYLCMVTFSLVIDWFTLGPKSTLQVLIFSKKYEEIADKIISMDRGVTALESIGWYTGETSKVLLVIVRETNYKSLVEVVKQIDEKAFVSVSKASSVYGEGFEQMKIGVKPSLKFRKKSDENKDS